MTGLRSRMRVFISSTSKDLQEVRLLLIAALSKLRDIDTAAMEKFGARPNTPLSESLAEVAECQLYVGIFANRYGFIPEGSSISITEAEYRHARNLGIPCLIFMTTEGGPIDDPESAPKLEALKAKLRAQHVCQWYGSTAELVTEVLIAVHNWVVFGELPKEQKLTGPERLRSLLSSLYTDSEFVVLCFDLGVKYDELPGQDRLAKTLQLIWLIRDRRRMSALRETLIQAHPGIAWNELFAATARDWLPIPWYERAWRSLRVWLIGQLKTVKAAGKRLLISAAVMTAIVIALKVFPLPHDQLLDYRADEFDRPTSDGKLDSAKWDYDQQKAWNLKDGHLTIEAPGSAVLSKEFLNGKRLYDFSLNFLVRIESGNEAAWVLRVQDDKKSYYRFALKIVGNQIYLSGFSDRAGGPERELEVTAGEKLVPIPEYRSDSDALEVEARAKGSTFTNTMTLRADHNIPDTRTFIDKPYFVATFKDPENALPSGSAGLLGPAPGGRILAYYFRVAPIRKWFFF